MGNNRSRPLSNFRCNAKAFAQFHTTHLFPVPIPVPSSVHRPEVLETCHDRLGLVFENCAKGNRFPDVARTPHDCAFTFKSTLAGPSGKNR